MIMACSSKIWGGIHTLTKRNLLQENNLNLCNGTRALKYLLCQLFSSIVSSITHSFFDWDTIWEISESVTMSSLGASKSSMEESILFCQYSFIIYSSCWTIWRNRGIHPFSRSHSNISNTKNSDFAQLGTFSWDFKHSQLKT